MSNFYVALSDIPQIIADVYSGGPEDDLSRMLAQGGSLVRLVNHLMGQTQQNFVLMALYFRDSRYFTQYLIFQEPRNNKVRGYVLRA